MFLRKHRPPDAIGLRREKMPVGAGDEHGGHIRPAEAYIGGAVGGDRVRFEHAPGKAVIYLVRDDPDISREVSTVMLDDNMMGSTYPGTYFRWVVDPGRHQIRGYAGDNGSFTLDAAPRKKRFKPPMDAVRYQ